MHKRKHEVQSHGIYNKLNKNQNADTSFNYDIVRDEMLQNNKNTQAKFDKCNTRKTSTWICPTHEAC